MGFFNRSKKLNNKPKAKTTPARNAPARVAKTIKGTVSGTKANSGATAPRKKVQIKQNAKPNTGGAVPRRKVSAKETVKPNKSAAAVKSRSGLAKANKTTATPRMTGNRATVPGGTKSKSKQSVKSNKSAAEIKSRSGLTKPADKNISKRYPNGRTLKTKDTYLPNKGAALPEPKDRRVAVIDSNRKDELAIVRLTSKKQPNTTEISGYGKGDIKTRYKHFVETKDNAGKPIKVDNKKFIENPKNLDVSTMGIKQIQNKVYHNVKQGQENVNKIKELKIRADKKKKDKKNPRHL